MKGGGKQYFIVGYKNDKGNVKHWKKIKLSEYIDKLDKDKKMLEKGLQKYSNKILMNLKDIPTQIVDVEDKISKLEKEKDKFEEIEDLEKEKSKLNHKKIMFEKYEKDKKIQVEKTNQKMNEKNNLIFNSKQEMKTLTEKLDNIESRLNSKTQDWQANQIKIEIKQTQNKIEKIESKLQELKKDIKQELNDIDEKFYSSPIPKSNYKLNLQNQLVNIEALLKKYNQ